MSYIETYNKWKEDPFFDEDTRKEVEKLKDTTEIEDRFYRELEFGTGGLRGVMGAGTNRVNKYTIGKATLGLGNYLLSEYGSSICQTRGVVIGYDTRNNSSEYSEIAAKVLSGMGIRVYLHKCACPTPQLSYAVRCMNAVAGVVLTASHNPKEYNGYKVYDEYGCQLVPWQAEQVIRNIKGITDYNCINFNENSNLVIRIDLTEQFVEEVLKQSILNDVAAKKALKVVYTPLHGTGYLPVKRVLQLDGFTNVIFVTEQIKPDGDFPTVVSPNPEDRRALEMGVRLAKDTEADIVLGTDPDSDRVGVAIKENTDYRLLTGNQIGALLMDYLLNNMDIQKYKNPAIIKTIVTSELGAEIARKKGLKIFSTLTGFKYIGEKINQFEKAKMKCNDAQNYDFVMGYEESYGYLIGTHARDKDAVVASLLICEMAAKYKSLGMTLADRLNELYDEFGYYHDALDSVTLKGKEGLEKIDTIMLKLRETGSPFKDTIASTDFSMPVASEEGFGNLPSSNVIRYDLMDGTWIAIRPSGTEPKLKVYYSVKGEDKQRAEYKFKSIQKILWSYLGINRGEK